MQTYDEFIMLHFVQPNAPFIHVLSLIYCSVKEAPNEPPNQSLIFGKGPHIVKTVDAIVECGSIPSLIDVGLLCRSDWSVKMADE